MSKKSVLSGRVFNKNHSSFIPQAQPILLKLKKEMSIKKIVVGRIINSRSHKLNIYTKRYPTSVRMQIKTRGQIQEFFLLGNNLDNVEQAINTIIN